MSPDSAPSVNTNPPDDENAYARRFAQELSKEEIWQAALNYTWGPYFPYPPDRPVVWVKFGDPWIQGEADMQTLAWQWVRAERQAGRCSAAINIPEVFRTFTNPSGKRVFIIMELVVNGTSIAKSVFTAAGAPLYPVDECFDLMAETIQLLRRMLVPPDATPGPYTPDHSLRFVRHPIFKDQRARVVYPDCRRARGHINRV
jgi:hypothetical protein